jgi:hypothetical protein
MHLPLNLISSKFLVTFVVPPALGTTADATLLLPNPMATRKKTRPSNPKRRMDKPNILAFFPKAKADCKETLQMAHTLRIKYLKDLVNSF